MSKELTAKHKQSYADNGFLILRGVFSIDELSRLEQGVIRAVQSGKCLNGDKPYPTPATQYTVEGQYQDDPDLLFIAEHPAVLGPVEDLLGGPACLSAFVSYLKTPGAGGTSGDYQGSSPTGHCDYKTYQQAGSSLNWLFAIFPLVDLDEETGPLFVSPGSHKASRIVPLNNRVSRVERASASDIPPMVDTGLCRGDLLFMHMFTWHEGKANRSDQDRFGIYNKYRALNAPPGCGPQLFRSPSRKALSKPGQRLLPHCSDLPFTEARLIVEREGKFLLRTAGDSWQLPGTQATIDDPAGQSVTAKLISQLEAALLDSFGLEIPWMSYVGDYAGTDGVKRVFAHSDEEALCAEIGREFLWADGTEVDKLARDGTLSNDDTDAIRTWSQGSYLRGIGESAERAKSAARNFST